MGGAGEPRRGELRSPGRCGGPVSTTYRRSAEHNRPGIAVRMVGLLRADGGVGRTIYRAVGRAIGAAEAGLRGGAGGPPREQGGVQPEARGGEAGSGGAGGGVDQGGRGGYADPEGAGGGAPDRRVEGDPWNGTESKPAGLVGAAFGYAGADGAGGVGPE